MKNKRKFIWYVVFAGLFAWATESLAATMITKTNYHGWPNSYVMSNGTVEAIVVPAIGRVMQFRFVGEETGPLFENRAMDGKHPLATSKEWGNFGGDKTWPAPQDDWPKVTPRGWPPPAAFDSMPVEAVIQGDTIALISPVDPHYGIRTERVISLEDSEPRMVIKTTYRKVEGEPRKVGVWVITQCDEPEFVYIPTFMGDRFIHQSEDLPYALKTGKRAIALKRGSAKSTKIGTDASALIWVGKKTALRIDSARVDGEEYPDKGSSAEVYTNANPLTYVELEMLGPMRTLKVGGTLSQTNTYRLYHRADLDSDITADPK